MVFVGEVGRTEQAAHMSRAFAGIDDAVDDGENPGSAGLDAASWEVFHCIQEEGAELSLSALVHR